MQIRDLIPWSRSKQEVEPRVEDRESPYLALQRELNRVFDDFYSRFERPFGAVGGLAGMTGPSADVTETENEIEVTVELPGMDEKDIDLSVSEDVLTIRGEKKAEREESRQGFYMSERSYGSFHRRIPLPAEVDTESVSAEFKKGVLTVILPKTPEAKAKVRRIEVKAA